MIIIILFFQQMYMI